MGRPREKNISDWGNWKRNQRASPGGKTGSGTCPRCGKRRSLNIHHKDAKQGDKSNNSSSNLTRYCDACHPKVEAKAKAIKERVA
jgi:hypothetical protein